MSSAVASPGVHRETDHMYKHVGTWDIVATAMRAKAIRASGFNGVEPRKEAHTGMYVPGAGFEWTHAPAPPAYVKDEAIRIVRRRRRELGLPI